MLFALLGGASMAYLLGTERGNRALSDFVAGKISSVFAGRMEIAHIDDLRIDRIVARGVRFIPPDNGPPAIDAPRVVMTFSAWKMLHGEYGWSRAEVDHPLVRVTENPRGKTNMEELFASPKGKAPNEPKKKDESSSPVAMENMVTTQAKLWLGGGSIPEMYLSELDGIMRIDIDPKGDATLRFDEYKGKLDGLPSGHLDFADVSGSVWTGGKRLLQFTGHGKNKGQPVEFGLEISTKPSDVRIDAQFDEVGVGSLAARMMAVWSQFSPGIDVEVRQQRN
ncbi:MAG TPA: hypothetical protein VFX59_09765 [Polyangiales bacterium]|nr:hypothetical protein [Polyangiales bacterium]